MTTAPACSGSTAAAPRRGLAGRRRGPRARPGPARARRTPRRSGADAARAALGRAIALAFADAGLAPAPGRGRLPRAGGVRPARRPAAARRAGPSESRWADRLVLVNDGDLVLAAGTPEGWGLGVIAGTGSIAVGRDRRRPDRPRGGLGAT